MTVISQNGVMVKQQQQVPWPDLIWFLNGINLPEPRTSCVLLHGSNLPLRWKPPDKCQVIAVFGRFVINLIHGLVYEE